MGGIPLFSRVVPLARHLPAPLRPREARAQPFAVDAVRRELDLAPGREARSSSALQCLGEVSIHRRVSRGAGDSADELCNGGLAEPWSAVYPE